MYGNTNATPATNTTRATIGTTLKTGPAQQRATDAGRSHEADKMTGLRQFVRLTPGHVAAAGDASD
jgi:hypothetical protein